MIARDFGRGAEALRPITIRPEEMPADGAVLYASGRTRVICSAVIADEVPDFLAGRGQGWLTATYQMLPGATVKRNPPKATPDGRSMEITRLIGRALRSALDLPALGPRTIYVDCAVTSADGGTRTAAINGGYVATVLALRKLLATGQLAALPLRRSIQAVSVGIVGVERRLDLCYAEDSKAELDLNVVGADAELLVEVQGTAEGQPFARTELDALVGLAFLGLVEIRAAQERALTIAAEARP